MSMLQGKTAWVTGAASGIGAAIAAELIACGATVFGTDVEPSGDIEACDMRDPGAIAAYAKDLASRADGLDILVNNAAVQRRKPFLDFTDTDYRAIFDTNVRGVFFASQSAARAMVSKGRKGAIVNICSVNADHAQPETVLYCAAKGSVRNMTKSLALALGRYEIRVNSVAPGTIATNLNTDRLSDAATVKAVEERTALGRVGVPSDVAPAVSFLASDAAAFITGATIAVHGGWTLNG